jgi:RNA polymerase sigma-70 factor (ECF subfamily)
VALYEALERHDPSPVVRLNHAVAVALAGDVDEGLSMLDAIEGLESYHLLHAARADLYRRLDRRDEAAHAYRRALELTTSDVESRFLERRLRELAEVS